MMHGITRFFPLLLLLFASAAPAFELSSLEQSVVDLTNAERAKAGLGELKPDEKLFKAARAHAANMAKKEEMAHKLDGKNVAERVAAAGFNYFTVGENVAFNQPDAKTLLKAWMDSPGHRENILNKSFAAIGIGIASSEKGEPYYAQVFARPTSAGPTVRAAISVRNDTDDSISVRLPNSKASTTIEAGGTGAFSLSGASDLPPAQAKIGGARHELPMKDGAKYVIRSTRRGVEITDTAAAENSKRERAAENAVETGGR